MKIPAILFALSALTLALTGCSESRAAAHANPEPTPACAYKAGVGLQPSPAGRAFLGLQTGQYAGRLPAVALLRTAKGDFVYVANGASYLRTPVKVGAEDARGFEITEGLYEGDTIVVAGGRGLWLAELQAVNGGVGCADEH